MPRRIDVELTSARQDGSFTWRAAGAKQPKGVVEGPLLYGGAKVGDVVRAEADFDIEGITIVSVVPPPHAAARTEPPRIEIVGTTRDEPGVTSSAVSRERGRDGDRPRGARPERGGPRPERGDRPSGPGGARGGERRGPRPEDRSERGSRPERGGRPERSPDERGSRPDRAGGGDRPGRPPRAAAGERARPKRLSPGSTHRDAYLASLAPEQQVVAELLLRGGIPAVRVAVAQQNQNRPEGAPVIDADPLVGLAEGLLPAVRQAEWHDRAEAAKATLDEVGLRDLRAIVTAGDTSARDEASKALAAELRTGLERRTTADREAWLSEMATCLSDGKVVRALRLSSRPPDPSTKVPAELLEQLRAAASEALGPDTPQDRWAALLEAVIASPVRRSVEPVGLPPQAGPALQLAARQASGRIPALATLLGVDLPPPPGLRTAGKGGKAAPPPPPRPRPPASATPADPEALPAEPAEADPAPAEPTDGAVTDAPAEATVTDAPAEADEQVRSDDDARAEVPSGSAADAPADEAPALRPEEAEVAADESPEPLEGATAADDGAPVSSDDSVEVTSPADA